MTLSKVSEVHIWFRDTASLDDEAVKSTEQYLSTEEIDRGSRFRFENDRRDFSAAHDLLRRALSRYADKSPSDWRFATNDYGKPSLENVDLKGRPLSFSLSHTSGCVVCAITSDVQIGVDVERVDHSRPVQEIADRYFAKEEAAWLRRCSDDQRNVRFVELWTLKEAFLKAIGVGVSGSLSEISFQFDDHTNIEFSGPPTIDPHEWHFALFEPISNVRAAVVIRRVARPCFFFRKEGDGGTRVPIRASARPLRQF